MAVEVECGAPVCTTHAQVVEVIGHVLGNAFGWCSRGKHYIREGDTNWGYEAVPLDQFLLLQIRRCLTCGEDRPARDVNERGWTCAACGTVRDASEPAKAGE